MRRFGWIPVCIAAILVAPGAAAGGGAWLKFERDYYAPGDPAIGGSQVWVGNATTGSVADGPYDAYLLPQGDFIRPPRIPDSAIRIGTLELEEAEGPFATAWISFEVPDVPAGRYSLQFCNRPCEQSIIGDLIGGSITVVPSPELIPLVQRIDRLERQLGQSRGNFVRRVRQVERLKADHDSLQAVHSGLMKRIDRLEAQVAAAERTEVPSGGPWGTVGWVVAAVGLVIAALAIRRSRKFGPRVRVVRRSAKKKATFVPMDDLSEEAPLPARDEELVMTTGRPPTP